MTRIISGLIVMFIILFTSYPAMGGQEDKSDLCRIDLLWAIIAETGCDSPKKVMALSGRDTLCSGGCPKADAKAETPLFRLHFS